MRSTFDTLIIPCPIELTPAGRMQAERIKERIKNGLLRCGCYEGACFCGQYPTREQLDAMEQEWQDAQPERESMTPAEEIEAEELRNFFGGPNDN